MKSTKTILFALFIAVSASAYAGGLIEMFLGGGEDKGPATNGKLTVSGLGRYNGKYVMGFADSDPALVAAGDISSGGVITAGVIKGGKATLKVWQRDADGFGSFDGNGTGTICLSIYDEAAPSSGGTTGLVETTFKKGSGSGTGVFIDSGAFGGAFSRVIDNGIGAIIAGGSPGGKVGGALAGILNNAVGSTVEDAVTIAASGRDLSGGASGGGEIAQAPEKKSGGLFARIFGGGKEESGSASGSSASSGGKEESGGDGGGLLGRLFGGGSDGGLDSWTPLREGDFPPDGTWVATFTVPLFEEGITMAIVHTFVLKKKEVTSNKMKQTISGANADTLWPALKMAYEGGHVPGTHRVNDKERSIETTYDLSAPIFDGAGISTGANTANKDKDYVFINGAKNRIKVVTDVMDDIFYIKQ